jgi:uncharacterized protein
MKKSLWAFGKIMFFTISVVVFCLTNSVFADQVRFGDTLRIKNVRTGEYLTVVDGGIFGQKQPSDQAIFKIMAGPSGWMLMAPDGHYVGRSGDTYVIYAAKRHLLGLNSSPTNFKILPNISYGDAIEIQDGNENVRMNVDIYTHPKGREVFFAGDDWRMTPLAKRWTKEFIFELVKAAPVISKPVVLPEPSKPGPIVRPVPPTPVVPAPDTTDVSLTPDVLAAPAVELRPKNLDWRGGDEKYRPITLCINNRLSGFTVSGYGNDWYGYGSKYYPPIGIDTLKDYFKKGGKIENIDINSAIKGNGLEVVKFLIDKGAAVKKADINIAIKNNNLEMLKYLVDKGANIDIKKVDTNEAIKNNNLEMLKYFVDKGADVKKTDINIAIGTNNFDMMKYLIEQGADIKKANISIAFMKDNLDMVKYLIDKGVEIEGGRTYEFGPQTRAYYFDEYLKKLQEPPMPGPGGVRPEEKLFEAAQNNNLDEAKKLLNQGAAVNFVGFDKMTPLHWAILNDNVEMVKLFVDKGAFVNLPDVVGNTAISEAKNKGNEKIIALVQKGKLIEALEPNVSSEEDIKKEQATRLERLKEWRKSQPQDKKERMMFGAISDNNLSALKNWVDAGADINCKDKKGNSPLHAAVEKGNLEIIKYLIGQKADVNAENGDGETPLGLAEQGKNKQIIDLLKSQKAQLSDAEKPIEIMQKMDINKLKEIYPNLEDPISHEDFKIGDKVAALSCDSRHIFLLGTGVGIEQWLKEHKTCPLCRANNVRIQAVYIISEPKK